VDSLPRGKRCNEGIELWLVREISTILSSSHRWRYQRDWFPSHRLFQIRFYRGSAIHTVSEVRSGRQLLPNSPGCRHSGPE
jgi:hypothetical protein